MHFVPLGNGIRTLKVLQSNPAFNFIPVYIWSELQSANEMKLYLNNGAHDYLVKPNEPDEWELAKGKLERALRR